MIVTSFCDMNQKILSKMLFFKVSVDSNFTITSRRVYHIVAYLQVGVYHIVAYHNCNFIRKWTSGICRVRKVYQI